MKMNSHQTGLALGFSFALWHFLWVVAVFIGLGQSILDLTTSLHFVQTSYQLSGLSTGTAILGVILAFICGYLTGYIFAWIWNSVAQKLKTK